MQFKPVPPAPDDLEALATVRDALPRVPRPESDCCGNLAARVDFVRDRDAAREWLVFLRALGLATRTADSRYVRSDADVDRAALAERFGEHVLAARPVLDALWDLSSTEFGAPNCTDAGSSNSADAGSPNPTESESPNPTDAGSSNSADVEPPKPATPDAVLERVASTVPEWERRRSTNWRATWSERVERLLEWWVRFGAVRAVDGGYLPVAE